MLHVAHVTFTNVTTTSIQGRHRDRAQRRNEARMPVAQLGTAAAALFESLIYVHRMLNSVDLTLETHLVTFVPFETICHQYW